MALSNSLLEVFFQCWSLRVHMCVYFNILRKKILLLLSVENIYFSLKVEYGFMFRKVAIAFCGKFISVFLFYRGLGFQLKIVYLLTPWGIITTLLRMFGYLFTPLPLTTLSSFFKFNRETTCIIRNTLKNKNNRTDNNKTNPKKIKTKLWYSLKLQGQTQIPSLTAFIHTK